MEAKVLNLPNEIQRMEEAFNLEKRELVDQLRTEKDNCSKIQDSYDKFLQKSLFETTEMKNKNEAMANRFASEIAELKRGIADRDNAISDLK